MAAMTSRERVLTAMRRQVPDRVPFGFTHGFSPAALETFKKNAQHDAPNIFFGTDTRAVSFRTPSVLPDYCRYYDDLPAGTWISPFGVAREPGSVEHFTHVVSPLKNAASLEAIEAYAMPDFARL